MIVCAGSRLFLWLMLHVGLGHSRAMHLHMSLCSGIVPQGSASGQQMSARTAYQLGWGVCSGRPIGV